MPRVVGPTSQSGGGDGSRLQATASTNNHATRTRNELANAPINCENCTSTRRVGANPRFFCDNPRLPAPSLVVSEQDCPAPDILQALVAHTLAAEERDRVLA